MAEFQMSNCPTMCLGKMNEAQRQAVVHGEGPLLLLAGPGSGKTFTITNRILYLLKQGVAPETILVITFTKEAALSMQERFRKMAAPDGSMYYPVNFGTFHSVFYHILQESHILQSSQLLRLSEKKTLLFPVLQSCSMHQEAAPGNTLQKINSYNVQDSYNMHQKTDTDNTSQRANLYSREETFNNMQEDVDQILAAISFYKNTMNLSATIGKVPTRWQSCFEEICQKYESAVRRTGRIDFDDMLYVCRTLLLENKAVRDYWQKRFCHILMDEFQDINPVQYEVVKLLSASPYNLFAVGDDDQAIYGFRGSEPDCLKRFQEEFHAKQLLLGINYRSDTEIVQASLAVIGENKNRFHKQLQAAKLPLGRETLERDGVALDKDTVISGKKAVILREFTVKEEEYAYMIKLLSAQVCTEESCAVLFRTNSHMQGFAARLKAAGIPYEMREKAASIYDYFIVADIMAYLQVAQGDGRREHMLRIMNKPSRYISREAVGKGPVDIRAIKEYYHQTLMPKRQKDSVLDALTQLEKHLQKIRMLSPLPAISYILKAAGYEQYLKNIARTKQGQMQEWEEVLEWLKEDASRFAGFREWKQFQEEYARALEQGGIQEGQRNAGMSQGRVQGSQDSAGINQSRVQEGSKTAIHLLTVHGSKGLEFDRVWILDCNEQNFPHGRMPDEKNVEEERRIFYVAMTRAKKSLELLYLTGTKERPRQPSRFLNPLREFAYSINSSNSQLSRYSSNASSTFSYSSSSSI